MNDSVKVSVRIKNSGRFDGEEVVQLYVRDLVGNGVARPLLQLKGFEKVLLKKGETKTVQFIIRPSDLAFYRIDKTSGPEAGQFEIAIGGSSDLLTLKSTFELKD